MSLLITILIFATAVAAVFVCTGLYDKIFGENSKIRSTLNEDIGKKKIHLPKEITPENLTKVIAKVNLNPDNTFMDELMNMVFSGKLKQASVSRLSSRFEIIEIIAIKSDGTIIRSSIDDDNVYSDKEIITFLVKTGKE